MPDPEQLWRGLVLAWSLLSAAGTSLTYIMWRASNRDSEQMARDEELGLLSRRVVRGVGSRLVTFVTYVVASGTMWTAPERAQEVASIAPRLSFSLVFAISAAVLLVFAVRDLMETLALIEERARDSRQQGGMPHA